MGSLHFTTNRVSTGVATAEAGIGGDDRRRRARLASRAPGWLLNDATEVSNETSAEPWEVSIRDVSRLGVGFKSGVPLAVGDTCRIRIGRGPMKLARRMRVVNCFPQADRTYTVGGEFC